MCSVASIDACSIPLSLFTAPACEYCRTAVWSKRGHVLASRQLSRLWLDVRNDLAICRAWVQLFCNGDGSETYGMDGR
ncbi:hypothetical protein HU200_008501 [Digitaria exilis]|uniref:Uncharacterized protein n=1 Tax=Digitaria exilis TaxID=1010633 RepID=A0A835KNS0_9POAL|nr:hypothetical protein HU200_008501 [Digitaria exilis]